MLVSIKPEPELSNLSSGSGLLFHSKRSKHSDATLYYFYAVIVITEKRNCNLFLLFNNLELLTTWLAISMALEESTKQTTNNISQMNMV
jgi:hypothetical protein